MIKKTLLTILASIAIIAMSVGAHLALKPMYAYTSSTTAYVEKAAEEFVFDKMDVTIPVEKYVSENVSGQYLMMNGTGQCLGWSTPITKMRDLVVEFDYVDDGDSMPGYYQFGPWNAGFNLQWPYFNAGLEGGCGVYNPVVSGAPANGLTIKDLTKEEEPVVCDRYLYAFDNNYRIRLTFKIDSGDLLIAKKPIGSTDPFVDTLKVIKYCTPPENISPESPVYFWATNGGTSLWGDFVMKYGATETEQEELIQAYDFNNTIGWWSGSGSAYPAPGYLVTSHPANFGLYNPIIYNPVEGERILSKEVVHDIDATDGDKTLFEFSFSAKYMTFGPSSQLRFLAVPADKPDAKWSDEGVSCLALLDSRSYGYYSGVDKYPGGTVGAPGKDNVDHFFNFKGIHLQSGVYSLQLWVDNNIFGGWAVDGFENTRIGIEFISSEASPTVIGFRKNINAKIYNSVAEGEDLGLNFDSYPDTQDTFYMDSEKWYAFATPSSQTADQSKVKGLHIEDNAYYFEGTSDNTMLSPKKAYGDFVLEFDYLDPTEKPALVDTWTVGYSPMGICFGRSNYNAVWAEKYNIMIYPNEFDLQCFGSVATVGNAAYKADVAGAWRRIKVQVVADKLSIYMLTIEEGKSYTDYKATDYTLVGEKQLTDTYGFVGFATTEAGYFKIDNVKITNIDTASAKTAFVDNAPIANSYVKATLTVNTESETKGTVTGGLADADLGATSVLTATANEHYTFSAWKDADGNTVSTENPYTHTIIGSTTLTAYFEAEKVTVTKTCDETQGVVNGPATVDYGSEVTLTAVAADHYRFVKWTVGGEEVGTDTTYTFTATANVEVTAVFEIITYTVTTNAENGTVAGANTYNSGATATLTATANEGYKFVKWMVGGEEVGTDTTYTFTVTADVEVTAVFEIITYTVTTVAEHGTVTGANTYNLGATVTLTATANEGYRFVKWTVGGEEVGTETTYTFTATANVEVTAVFEILSYTVTVTTENGTVVGAGVYNHGAECTLTATANNNYMLDKWTIGDEVVSREETYTFTVTGDVEIVAVFVEAKAIGGCNMGAKGSTIAAFTAMVSLFAGVFFVRRKNK